jgi:hypothetical protein
MTTTTPNPFEAAARERKVTDLTNALLRGHTRLLVGADFVAVVNGALATACEFGEPEWEGLAVAAGRRPPSEITVAAVLERLEGMLPTPAHEADPFAGLEAS